MGSLAVAGYQSRLDSVANVRVCLVLVFLLAADSAAAEVVAPGAFQSASRDFQGIILSSVINVGAILFGVFGFLYSVYAMHASSVTAGSPDRPLVCNDLTSLCRLLSVVLVWTFLVTVVALTLMWPSDWWDRGLAISLCLLTLVMAGVSWAIAFRWMTKHERH